LKLRSEYVAVPSRTTADNAILLRFANQGAATLMEAIDYWKLCTEYSIVQAALLVTGNDPDELQHSVEQSARTPVGYTAVRTALVHAIRSRALKASVAEHDNDFGGGS
jgi:hypothetical protein